MGKHAIVERDGLGRRIGEHTSTLEVGRRRGLANDCIEGKARGIEFARDTEKDGARRARRAQRGHDRLLDTPNSGPWRGIAPGLEKVMIGHHDVRVPCGFVQAIREDRDHGNAAERLGQTTEHGTEAERVCVVDDERADLAGGGPGSEFVEGHRGSRPRLGRGRKEAHCLADISRKPVEQVDAHIGILFEQVEVRV